MSTVDGGASPSSRGCSEHLQATNWRRQAPQKSTRTRTCHQVWSHIKAVLYSSQGAREGATTVGKADAEIRQLLKHTPKHERADREASLSRHGHEPAAGVKGRDTQRQQAAFAFCAHPNNGHSYTTRAASTSSSSRGPSCPRGAQRCMRPVVPLLSRISWHGSGGLGEWVWFECGHTCLKDGEELGIVQCHVVDVGSNL